MRTPEEMDLWLWSKGYSLWIEDPYSATTTVPHELDYLRGLHDTHVLTALAEWLAQKTSQIQPIRLRSMWQDKYAYVRPYTPGSVALKDRELGDVAVIVQRFHKGQRRLLRSMWILQAKVSESPTSAFKGGASKKEIELLEGMPSFDLLDREGGNPISTPRFPANAFAGPKHWSFLTFHRDPKKPYANALVYPVRQRWTGSVSPAVPAQPTNHSFCETLLGVIQGAFGMPVGVVPPDEWSRLYDLLMNQAMVKPTIGHAISTANPSGSVMQFCAASLASLSTLWGRVPSSWMRFVAFGNRRRYWPSRAPLPTFAQSRNVPSSRWLEMDDFLIAEAFDRNPPDTPHSAPSDAGDGPGFPLILFIDVDGDG